MSRKMRRLHLGCFDRAIEGWVNTDISLHVCVARIPGAARVLRALGLMTAERLEQHRRGVFDGLYRLDLTKRLPWRDGEFEVAFTAHVFEHLYRDDAKRCAYREGSCPDIDHLDNRPEGTLFMEAFKRG